MWYDIYCLEPLPHWGPRFGTHTCSRFGVMRYSVLNNIYILKYIFHTLCGFPQKRNHSHFNDTVFCCHWFLIRYQINTKAKLTKFVDLWMKECHSCGPLKKRFFQQTSFSVVREDVKNMAAHKNGFKTLRNEFCLSSLFCCPESKG
jgi:hypothetical protein